MDEQYPSRQRPQSNHPNAVNYFSEGAEQPPATPTPREPLPPQYQKEKSKKGRYFIILLVIVLVTAAAYWFLLRPKPAKAPAKSTSRQTSSSSSVPRESKVDTDHYDSSNFNLGFDYPKGWKVSDVSGSGKLTAASPALKIKDTNNQQVDGQIIITIRDKTQKLSEFDKSAATAVLNSEKITYTKPTQTQRGDTYVSFLSYAGSSSSGLDSIYITGDAGYQKDQDVPAVDISKIDPITNVTFLKCSDSKCSGTGSPLTIATQNWQDSSFSSPIKTMLQSLAIQ
jgi:hypothetical protein